METKFKIGQLIKVDDSYYVIVQVSKQGYPNIVYHSDKYKNDTLKNNVISNINERGWDLEWEIIKPLDIKHVKYEKVLAKIKQLDHKFKNRNQVKKDLTNESILTIITRLAKQQHEQS